MDKLIGAIGISRRSEARVALRTYKDRTRVDIRLHVPPGLGADWVPTKRGVSVPPELLPELLSLLEQAKNEAGAAGLIPKPPSRAGAREVSDADS